ncbi:MAG: fibronectin type III-like domain-contianing protein [Spirochaetota bacterium]
MTCTGFMYIEYIDVLRWSIMSIADVGRIPPTVRPARAAAGRPALRRLRSADVHAALIAREMLAPGESTFAVITVRPNDLARYDVGRPAWRIEPGEHALRVGFSSACVYGQ